MIPNNNFYGKKHGKTIRDFATGYDYKLETVGERLDFLKNKLEIANVNGVECAHDFFIELFDQTFDTKLERDGVYWVEEEQTHMTCDEFKRWAERNGIDIDEYLDIQTAFDNIEYEDESERGAWVYSNTNTSSVKLILNSSDAQYSEGNVAKELSKMADYILVKDEKKKEKVRLYSEDDFKKRLRNERKRLAPLEDVNGEEFAVLKRFGNYRLAPKMEILKDDFKLPKIYRGTYENYLEHWKTHQYKKVLVEGKYVRVYLKECELNSNSLSECLTEYQWIKGRDNMLQKISLLEDATKNKNHLNGIKNQMRQGDMSSGLKLMHVTNNIRNINEYMTLVKEHYNDYVCIKPEKCSVSSNIMDIIDYSNDKHILALIGLNVCDDDLNNDISILSYDINKAIKKAIASGELGKLEIEIIKLLRQGETKKSISKKISLSRVTVYKKLDIIIKAVKKYLN